jgi:spore germination protein YaaH
MLYIVQYGDTLGNIAYRFGSTVRAIVFANHIINPNYIYPGMTLYIPIHHHHHHFYHHQLPYGVHFH